MGLIKFLILVIFLTSCVSSSQHSVNEANTKTQQESHTPKQKQEINNNKKPCNILLDHLGYDLGKDNNLYKMTKNNIDDSFWNLEICPMIIKNYPELISNIQEMNNEYDSGRLEIKDEN
jgi:hypothetical protein